MHRADFSHSGQKFFHQLAETSLSHSSTIDCDQNIGKRCLLKLRTFMFSVEELVTFEWAEWAHMMQLIDRFLKRGLSRRHARDFMVFFILEVASWCTLDQEDSCAGAQLVGMLENFIS